MKKISVFTVFLFVVCCFVCVGAFAATVGSPNVNGKGNLSLTITQEVSQRDLDNVNFAENEVEDLGYAIYSNETSGGMTNTKYRGNNSVLKVSYGACDFLDVYAKVGIGRGKIRGSYNMSENDTYESLYDSNTDFRETNGEDETSTNGGALYGGGVKASIPIGRVVIGLDGQYSTMSDYFRSSGVGITRSTYSSNWGKGISNYPVRYDEYQKLLIEEWQFSASVGMKVGSFTPYAGVLNSHLTIKDKSTADYYGDDQRIKTISEKEFGIFAGVDYNVGQNWSINAEAHALNEQSGSVSVSKLF